MNMQAAWISVALLIAGGVSFAATQAEARAGGRQDSASRLERPFGQRHARLGDRQQRRQRVRNLVRSLDITEQQREQGRGVARSLQPIVDDVRPRARLLLAQARELARSGNRGAARELLQSELRPMLEDALERARPLVRPLVGTLSPDQRAKLERAAQARGRTFDEDRFTRRLTWMLARRGARR